MAAVGVHSAVPRDWTPAEIRLVEEVGDRTWAALERARVEAALRKSEEERRSLIAEMNEGFCILAVVLDEAGQGVDYRFLETNPAFVRQAGFDPAGRLMSEIAPIEPIWPAAYGRIATSGAPERIVAAAASLGRSYDAYAFRTGAATDRRVAVFFRDITERQRIETALRESEERLSQFGEASSDVLWIRDAETFQWTYLTPAFETIYGIDRATALSGDNMAGWVELIEPEDRERAVESLRRVQEGERVSFEYRIRRPSDGAVRWLRNTDFPMRDAGGEVRSIGGIGRDITDQKETADRMQVLVAELQHRTRNLMGVVRSTTETTLRSSRGLDDFAPSFRDRINALARVQNLLSRLDEHDRVTFDELIGAEMAALGQPEGSDRVTMEGPFGIALRSSTVQTLALALHELATNAVKYGALGQPDGHLAVRWRLERAAEDGTPWLHVDWEETGVAMPPADAAAQGGGSGRALIELALPYQLGARTTYVMTADGVRCSIGLPVSARTAIREAHGG